jgi:hypothetical protein
LNSTVTPIERPDVIVPDTGPLIHLALTDALHLLHQIGARVVVADMVAFEATQDITKPGAQEIQDWLDAGQKPNSNAPILIAPTEIGRLFAKARTVDPNARAKDAGELAIMQWLGNYVDYHSDTSILIVYENGKIPRFVRETGLDMATDVLTTRAFLELAERQGVVNSAADCWQRIVNAAPTANPQVAVMSIRQPKKRNEGSPAYKITPFGRC